MADLNATLNTRKLMTNVTMTVHVKHDWRVPFGLWLIKLGAWVAGIGAVKVEGKDFKKSKRNR